MLSYILAFVVFVFVLVANTLGPEALNISLRYFDGILHLLGGIGLGFLFCGLTVSGVFRQWHTMWRITLIVFLCGLAWELFEIYFDITGYALWTTMYYLDTVKDLILDTIGGALAAYLMIKR